MAATTATKPLTTEAIALTEKKMDMTLDDIIKMSKKPEPKIKKQRVPNKNQKFFNGGAVGAARGKSLKVRQFMDSRSSVRQGALAQRRSSFQGNHFPLATEVARKAMTAPIHNRPFNHNRPVNWNKPRIGALPVQRTAERRFGGKQMQQPAKMMLPKQRPQTLDSLFANMKEERMRVQSQQNNQQRMRVQSQQNNQQRMGVQSQQNYARHGVVGGGQQQQQQQQQRGRGRGWFGN